MVGRPNNNEVDNCDRACCNLGFLTGNCYREGQAGIVITNPWGPGPSKIGPAPFKISSHCMCSNDLRDAKCGPDGSFVGIRCPFDKSACQRKCCRQGKSGGRCGGFLKSKCKCD